MLMAGVKTESFAAALVPRFSVAGLIMKDDATIDLAKWGGSKVERFIEIFPRQDAGFEGCWT